MNESELRGLWDGLIAANDTGDPDATYGPLASGDDPGHDALPAITLSGGDTLTDAVDTLSGSPTIAPDALPEDGAPGAPPGPPGLELREERAREGAVVVHHARQTALGRDVAVRRLLDGSAAATRDRFVAEGLVAGHIDHPNVVPVHGLLSDAGGEPMIVTKLLEGPSWSDRLAADEPGLAEHLEVLRRVCDAVAFAHRRGIVHADLKPRHVAVGDYGEVLVGGWGVAVDVRDEPGPAGETITLHRSAIGGPFGTPRYMAPELARGDGAAIGPATDVYLLGAILHEILTGRPPHRGADLVETIVAASESRPPTLGKDAPPELADLCRRALAPSPADRPPDAAAFADALDAFAAHRQSALIAEAAAIQLSRCVDTSPEDEAARNALYTELAGARAGFRRARTMWEGNEEAAAGERRATLAYARAALAQGDLGLADAQLAGLGEADGEAAMVRDRIAQARALRERAARRDRVVGRTLIAAVAAVIVGLGVGLVVVGAARDEAEAARTAAAEQRRLADAGRRAAEAATREATVAAAALAAQRRRTEEELGRALLDAAERALEDEAFLDAEVLFARALTLGQGEPARSGGLLARAQGWRLAWARAVDGRPDAAPTLAISPDGHLLATTAADELQLRKTADGSVAGRGRVTTSTITSVVFSPDGRSVAAGAADGRVTIFSVATGAPIRTLEGHEAAVHAIDWSADGERLATASADRSARIWSVADGSLERTLPHQDDFTDITFGSPKSSIVTTADRGGAIRFFRTTDGEALSVRHEDDVAVTRVAFRDDMMRMASGNADGTVRIWNSKGVLKEIEAHDGAVRSLAWVGDFALASAGADGKVRLFGAAGGDAQVTITAHRAGAMGAVPRPDGRGFFTIGADGAVRAWEHRPPPDPIDRMPIFSPDGKTVGLFDQVDAVELRDADADADATVATHPTWGSRAALANDHVATIERRVVDSELRARGTHFFCVARETRTGRLRYEHDFGRSGGPPIDFRFSPTVPGWIAILHQLSLTVVDFQNRRLFLELQREHQRSIAWRPDGRALAIGRTDEARLGARGEVAVIELPSRKWLWTVPVHSNYQELLGTEWVSVHALAWSPDGRLLATAARYGHDHGVRVLDGETGRQTATLLGHEQPIQRLAWDPKGAWLASVDEQTARLWDVAAARCVLSLPVQGKPFGRFGWWPEGARLAIGSVWERDALEEAITRPPDEVLAEAGRRTGVEVDGLGTRPIAPPAEASR